MRQLAVRNIQHDWRERKWCNATWKQWTVGKVHTRQIQENVGKGSRREKLNIWERQAMTRGGKNRKKQKARVKKEKREFKRCWQCIAVESASVRSARTLKPLTLLKSLIATLNHLTSRPFLFTCCHPQTNTWWREQKGQEKRRMSPLHFGSISRSTQAAANTV